MQHTLALATRAIATVVDQAKEQIGHLTDLVAGYSARQGQRVVAATAQAVQQLVEEGASHLHQSASTAQATHLQAATYHPFSACCPQLCQLSPLWWLLQSMWRVWPPAPQCTCRAWQSRPW